MATILDRVPLDRITTEAKKLHFWRTVLTLIAGLFFLLGWIVAKTVMLIWAAIAWCVAAVKIGWQDARRPRGR